MSQPPPPEITASVTFLATEEGGRNGPTPSSGRIGFPMQVDGQYFDAFFNLSETGAIAPGQTVTAGLKFLSPDLVVPLLAVGKEFSLWEGKLVAKGRVLAIHGT
jgi:hypothetical protein